MQMSAAVESVGGSEGQRERQFAVSESAPMRAAASSWAASSERVGVSEGRVKASLQPLRARPLGPVTPYQAPGWATLAEKQKKC